MPALLIATALSGCHSGSSSTAPKPSASPSPSSPIPALAAKIGGLDVTLFDTTGLPMAQVKASSGMVRPTANPTSSPSSGLNAVGSLTGSEATLYEKGKPTAHMTADSIQGDQQTQTVTGVGNVAVRSLASPDAPGIRADRMVWSYPTGTIKGSGNVLITRKPDLRVPGKAFTADTQLRTFHLTGNGPATGTL